MIAVAFFRNLNHGQAETPRAAELVEIFRSSGAEAARTIRGNGTVAVAASDPEQVIRSARDQIERRSDWRDTVLIRSLDWLEQLEPRLEDAGPATEVTLFDSPMPFPHPIPWRPERGRITVEAADDRHAICTTDERSTGLATPTMQRVLGVPATSRTAATVLLACRAARGLAERSSLPVDPSTR